MGDAEGSSLCDGRVPEGGIALIDAVDGSLIRDPQAGVGQHKVSDVLVEGECTGRLSGADDHDAAAANASKCLGALSHCKSNVQSSEV